MDFRDIKKIVELMDQHGLSQFKLEQDDTKLELKKGGEVDMKAIQQWMASVPAPQYMPSYVGAPPAPAAATPAPAEGALPDGALPAGVKEVTSPMVGTFYAASSPDAEPFAAIGTKVTADSTVCIIEAMKVMNEIKSEIAGEIIEVLVENGTAVQYGEPLFRVKTS
ncbi:MAG: acetyl-CoA carboxylase biotin carboxyl carrier protein [Verrucomicrobiaceae bacterium]|nr:acetyl-CoA carboxylase biotin carboxyl carrier protein [Verrucomicrobiaceae bacterium]